MFQWKCSRGGAPNPFNHQKWMTHISFVWQKISKFQLYFCQDKFQLYLYETEISGLESMEDFSYEHRQWLPVLYLKCSPTVNIEERAGDDAVDVASVLAHVLKNILSFCGFFQNFVESWVKKCVNYNSRWLIIFNIYRNVDIHGKLFFQCITSNICQIQKSASLMVLECTN